MSNSKSFVDNGDREDSKISDGEAEKGTDAEEVEVVNRQMAPKVSVKVERKQNLGHYNNVSAQVFMSSGTLERYRGDILDEDGRVKEQLQKELNNIAEDLEKLARNRVLDALKKEAERGISVDTDIHEVDSGHGNRN